MLPLLVVGFFHACRAILYQVAIKAFHGFDRFSPGQKRGFTRESGRLRARRAVHGPHTNKRSKLSFERLLVLMPS
jgi:hypothetical protein